MSATVHSSFSLIFSQTPRFSTSPAIPLPARSRPGSRSRSRGGPLGPTNRERPSCAEERGRERCASGTSSGGRCGQGKSLKSVILKSIILMGYFNRPPLALLKARNLAAGSMLINGTSSEGWTGWRIPLLIGGTQGRYIRRRAIVARRNFRALHGWPTTPRKH